MPSPEPGMKISWTWEEWQASRAARKAISDRITPESIRRRESSSDPHLKKAFDGARGPKFKGAREQSSNDHDK